MQAPKEKAMGNQNRQAKREDVTEAADNAVHELLDRIQAHSRSTITSEDDAQQLVNSAAEWISEMEPNPDKRHQQMSALVNNMRRMANENGFKNVEYPTIPRPVAERPAFGSKDQRYLAAQFTQWEAGFQAALKDLAAHGKADPRKLQGAIWYSAMTRGGLLSGGHLEALRIACTTHEVRVTQERGITWVDVTDSYKPITKHTGRPAPGGLVVRRPRLWQPDLLTLGLIDRYRRERQGAEPPKHDDTHAAGDAVLTDMAYALFGTEWPNTPLNTIDRVTSAASKLVQDQISPGISRIMIEVARGEIATPTQRGREGSGDANKDANKQARCPECTHRSPSKQQTSQGAQAANVAELVREIRRIASQAINAEPDEIQEEMTTLIDNAEKAEASQDVLGVLQWYRASQTALPSTAIPLAHHTTLSVVADLIEFVTDIEPSDPDDKRSAQAFIDRYHGQSWQPHTSIRQYHPADPRETAEALIAELQTHGVIAAKTHIYIGHRKYNADPSDQRYCPIVYSKELQKCEQVMRARDDISSRDAEAVALMWRLCFRIGLDIAEVVGLTRSANTRPNKITVERTGTAGTTYRHEISLKRYLTKAELTDLEAYLQQTAGDVVTTDWMFVTAQSTQYTPHEVAKTFDEAATTTQCAGFEQLGASAVAMRWAIAENEFQVFTQIAGNATAEVWRQGRRDHANPEQDLAQFARDAGIISVTEMLTRYGGIAERLLRDKLARGTLATCEHTTLKAWKLPKRQRESAHRDGRLDYGSLRRLFEKRAVGAASTSRTRKADEIPMIATSKRTPGK